MGATSWARLRYNSADRSKRLRNERRAYEQEMRGTFEDQEKGKVARIKATGEQQRQTQSLADEGALTRTQATVGGTLERQRIANKPDFADIEAKKGYYASSAELNKANAAQKQFELSEARKDIPYTQKLREESIAKPPVGGTGGIDVGGNISKPNEDAIEDLSIGYENVDDFETAYNKLYPKKKQPLIDIESNWP